MELFHVKRLTDTARIPTRGTAGSAGLDLYADLSQPLELQPGQRGKVPTGIAIAVPEGYAGLIYARSGLAVKHGITLSNCVGVVDSDYRGEVIVGLINLSEVPFSIQPGDRIAQLVLTPVLIAEPVESESLDDTVRGSGGFGSTGRN